MKLPDAWTLRHYAVEPIAQPIRSTSQIATAHMKPRGFWVSVDGCNLGWSEWCEGEQFGLRRLVYAHDMTLAKDAKVLLLRGAKAIDAFTRRYGASLAGIRNCAIDWEAVAEKHKGIIIAPYVWSRRLHPDTSWYYGWDCASGCIWDASAIESVDLIQREKVREVT